MKGLSVVYMMMGATVLIAGLYVILMGSTGETPIYYHTLPEIQFSELLTSFLHTETNLQRVIEMDSDRLFENMQETPIVWDNSWNSYEDFMSLFEERFGDSVSDYFASVYVLEGANVESSIVDASGAGSNLDYNLGTEILTWEYTYEIHLTSKMFGAEVANEINTVRSGEIEFDFLNLEEVYDCADDFFNSGLVYRFQECSSSEITNGLANKFLSNLPASCDGFDISVKAPVFCGVQGCKCDSMKSVKTTLFISKEGKKSVAFISEFSTFECGEPENTCVKGTDCLGEDYCVNGFCGKCYAAGLYCSSDETLFSSGMRECSKIPGGVNKYECLQKWDVGTVFKIYMKVGDDVFEHSGLEPIILNCGKQHKSLILEGLSDYFFKFNGVNVGTGELDLCDASKVPRVSGRLTIYDNSEGVVRSIGDIYVSFAVSDAINELNGDEFAYYFNSMDCAEFKTSTRDLISKKIKYTGIEGYAWSIYLPNCNTNPATWYGEQYNIFTIDFIETKSGKTVATATYIIEYKADI
ncbi:MAG: hypothetical protein DRP06_02020 [Candidatus Aenigmatarchaeota archaeon]|nr:MAG: hypothetical protein DRP06_02020 [Candidatus Aenigmarchaeota archaeon]